MHCGWPACGLGRNYSNKLVQKTFWNEVCTSASVNYTWSLTHSRRVYTNGHEDVTIFGCWKATPGWSAGMSGRLFTVCLKSSGLASLQVCPLSFESFWKHWQDTVHRFSSACQPWPISSFVSWRTSAQYGPCWGSCCILRPYCCTLSPLFCWPRADLSGGNLRGLRVVDQMFSDGVPIPTIWPRAPTWLVSRIAPFTREVLLERFRCSLTIWRWWGIVKGRVWRLPTVISFRPKARLTAPVSGLD